MREAAANMLAYAACFSLLVCDVAYGSALTTWASRVIESKFILHVLKGFWGFLGGSLLLQLKALPRLISSPLVGAVRGAVVNTFAEIDKFDARLAEFDARYFKEMKEEQSRMSGGSSHR